MNKECRLTEQQRRVCEYCSYRTKWMKWLLSFTLTKNEQEYDKEERILTTMNISGHQKRRNGQNSYTRTETELQFEIECPRCYDTMELCSDFNGLHYFCEQCGFSLHT